MTDPHPDTAPDFGDRNADLIVKRALNHDIGELARDYGTTVAALRAFFARHGEPTRIIGRIAQAFPPSGAPRRLIDFSEPRQHNED